MSKKKKTKKTAVAVPRLGPPVNVRPAGPHTTERDLPRAIVERKALEEAQRETE